MNKHHRRQSSGRLAARLGVGLMVVILLLLCGCAPGIYRPPAYPEYMDKPGGPGTIPRTWYDSDPSLEGWFSPWYVNPYQQ